MLYLYLGYLFIQSFPVVKKLTNESIAPTAVFFSLIVFLIWSFIPVLGYTFACLIKQTKQQTTTILLIYGALVALIENSLFYFNILTYEENILSTLLSALLFFVVAFMPKKREM
ncbi:hypothetical protein AADZ91_13605 [Colwelliaceae bacterium 6441]